MQIIHSNQSYDGIPVAACIGFFDGVHCGHRFLIDELILEAKKRGLAPAIITFKNHPKEIIEPSYHPGLLSSFDEKMHLLENTGIEYCFVLDFTPELRELTAREFMEEILYKKFKTKLLLIGYDHHFGKKSQENFEDYKQYGEEIGIEVLKKKDFRPNGVKVSSSEIRKLLLSKNIEKANELLGYAYNISGKVVHGNQIGRTIGFPTANIELQTNHQLIPEKGVYIGSAKIGEMEYPAMINIGNRPTIGNNQALTIEAYLLGFQGDLYHQNINLSFLQFLRDEQKMSSLEGLKELLIEDKKATLSYFNTKKSNNF